MQVHILIWIFSHCVISKRTASSRPECGWLTDHAWTSFLCLLSEPMHLILSTSTYIVTSSFSHNDTRARFSLSSGNIIIRNIRQLLVTDMVWWSLHNDILPRQRSHWAWRIIWRKIQHNALQTDLWWYSYPRFDEVVPRGDGWKVHQKCDNAQYEEERSSGDGGEGGVGTCKAWEW